MTKKELGLFALSSEIWVCLRFDSTKKPGLGRLGFSLGPNVLKRQLSWRKGGAI